MIPDTVIFKNKLRPVVLAHTDTRLSSEISLWDYESIT